MVVGNRRPTSNWPRITPSAPASDGGPLPADGADRAGAAAPHRSADRIRRPGAAADDRRLRNRPSRAGAKRGGRDGQSLRRLGFPSASTTAIPASSSATAVGRMGAQTLYPRNRASFPVGGERADEDRRDRAGRDRPSTAAEPPAAASVTGVSAEIGHPLGCRPALAVDRRLRASSTSAWRPHRCLHGLERTEGRTVLHLTSQIDLGPASVLDPMRAAMRPAVWRTRTSTKTASAHFPELRPDPGEWRSSIPAPARCWPTRRWRPSAPRRTRPRDACGERVTSSTTAKQDRITSDRHTRDADLAVLATGPWATSCWIRWRSTCRSLALAQVTFFDGRSW